MARKKYNYNFVRKPSEGGKEALYMAGASVFLFLLASVVSFAFRGNGGIFLGAAGLFSFLLSGYGFYVGMKSFKEEQVSHRMSVLGSITSGGMLVAWLALFLIVFPSPLKGRASRTSACSFSERYGSASTSRKRRIRVDFPVRTGPTTPIRNWPFVRF